MARKNLKVSGPRAAPPVAAERKVKLRISGPASGVLVTGVRDELSQVAQNLLDNAGQRLQDAIDGCTNVQDAAKTIKGSKK